MGNSSRSDQTSSFLSGVNKCLYCWEADHYLKQYCQAFHDELNSRQIHLNEVKTVCLGTYLLGTRPVFMRRKKPGRDSVANAEKLRYLNLPPADVGTIIIGEQSDYPYLIDH